MQVYLTNHIICMKPLITLLLALCLYNTSNAQSHIGVHVGGMPFVSFDGGLSYMYSFGRNDIGISVGTGAYGLSLAVGGEGANLDEETYDGSEIDQFYSFRIFYNRILSKRSQVLYTGAGLQHLNIENKPWSNLVAYMPEVHTGVNLRAGKRLRINMELAIAVGTVTGDQERITDFGREIQHGTQLALYIPITTTIYWAAKKR